MGLVFFAVYQSSVSSLYLIVPKTSTKSQQTGDRDTTYTTSPKRRSHSGGGGLRLQKTQGWVKRPSSSISVTSTLSSDTHRSKRSASDGDTLRHIPQTSIQSRGTTDGGTMQVHDDVKDYICRSADPDGRMALAETSPAVRAAKKPAPNELSVASEALTEKHESARGIHAPVHDKEPQSHPRTLFASDRLTSSPFQGTGNRVYWALRDQCWYLWIYLTANLAFGGMLWWELVLVVTFFITLFALVANSVLQLSSYVVSAVNRVGCDIYMTGVASRHWTHH